MSIDELRAAGRVCQCEHASHWPPSEGGTGPKEGDTLAMSEHRYGRGNDRLEPCRTCYGTLLLCWECRRLGHGALPLSDEDAAMLEALAKPDAPLADIRAAVGLPPKKGG